ncbi:MAG: transposase [Lachnospiraceae bacterium]|nr:transposase [Lachnospiraceae bacterium]
MAYIHYVPNPNGTVYASVCESYREGGHVKTRRIMALGRVIDKEKNIFYQKGRMFQYTVDNGRTEVPADFYTEPLLPSKEKLILDFGDGWFFKEFLERQPFYDSIAGILPGESDTVLSLVAFRLLTCKTANCHAKFWYEGNYAYLGFPHANMTSQNIARVLKKLGDEEVQRRFFNSYISCLYPGSNAAGILIDSTGVPNATKMNVTQVSNHNGDINREVRVIYVIDRENGMPIYFRYVAGNIVDVSTLITTVGELQQYSVSVSQAILDAGYFSEGNAAALFESGIPFLTRIAPNKTIFKEAIKTGLEGLMSQEHAYRYGKRLVFIRKMPMDVCSYRGYLYLCLDEDIYLMQHKKIFLNGIDEGRSSSETDKVLTQTGLFALLSSEDMKEDDLLPLYYTRQQVEQVFDITKNYADLLPIRVQTEESFAGHLMISFIATLVAQQIQRILLKKRSRKAKELNGESIWSYLRSQKCKIYDNYAIPQEPRKEVNAIYNIFKMDMPHKIPLEHIEV